METDAERIEKDISKRSEGFRKQQGSLTVTMKEVQQELAADEAVVEFVSFRLYTSKATDSVIYAAYIFKKGDAHARFIPLFEENNFRNYWIMQAIAQPVWPRIFIVAPGLPAAQPSVLIPSYTN